MTARVKTGRLGAAGGVITQAGIALKGKAGNAKKLLEGNRVFGIENLCYREET
jgi:hypothetical protein